MASISAVGTRITLMQRYTAHKKKIKSNIYFKKKKRKLFISNSINLLIIKKAFSPLWYLVSIEEYKFSLYSRDLKMIMAKYMSADPCLRKQKITKLQAGNKFWDFLNQTREKYHL
jgi:hypothetical protein